MSRRVLDATVILALRLMLLVVGLVLLGAQLILVPAMAELMVRVAPWTIDAQRPYVAAGVLALACAQVVLVAVWIALTEISAGHAFGATMLRCVDAAAIASGVALLLELVVAFHALVTIQLEAAPVTAALGLAVTLTVTCLLLVLVVRMVVVRELSIRPLPTEVGSPGRNRVSPMPGRSPGSSAARSTRS